MSSQSLTAKYRPQRFSDVAGQEAIKRILSKASAEDKVAAAYLFSGTRGVGKTTLARVMAKALNCLTAPTAEPCNVCSQCRQITAGVSPDVVEIDAATHGNVEEARRLKEDIGYAPLQSRYKVFIIDEAHMLSKAAFNALLKTLEEPPGRVTFILATTEPHKILPTIISRCQHYIFKRLMQPELESHLAGLLDQEGMGYEPSAVSLIARRGAGSVRDSMSLLAQVLAMGGERLIEQDVRDVLGLAGQDVFYSFMRSFKELDCLGVSGLLRQVLDRGLDIGFFLRELASCWRNMFLLNQAGEKALSTLELTEEEGRQWLGWAGQFDARHIHACWQMTLEGQRRVMTSLEPALALELLLLNLAYIPKLLTLESMSGSGPQSPGRPPSGPGGPGAMGGSYGGPRPGPAQPGQGYAPPSRPGPGYGGPQGGPAPSYGAPQAAPAQTYGGPQSAPQGYGVQPGGSAPAQNHGGPQGGPAPSYGGPQAAPGQYYGASQNGPAPAALKAVPRSPYKAPQGSEGEGGSRAPGGPGPAGRTPPPWDESPSPDPEPGAQASSPGPGGPVQGYGQPQAYDAPPQPPGRSPATPQENFGPGTQGQGAPMHPSGRASTEAYGEVPAAPAGRQAPLGPPTWKGFRDFVQRELKDNPLLRVALPQLSGSFDGSAEGGVLRLSCKNDFQAAQIKDKPENLALFTRLANAYFACPVTLAFDVAEARKQMSQQELRAKAEQSALFKEARESMGAYIIDVRTKH